MVVGEFEGAGENIDGDCCAELRGGINREEEAGEGGSYGRCQA